MKFWKNILRNSEKREDAQSTIKIILKTSHNIGLTNKNGGNNLEKWYYKITDSNDNETEFYVSFDLPIKEDKVCSFLGLDGFQQK